MERPLQLAPVLRLVFPNGLNSPIVGHERRQPKSGDPDRIEGSSNRSKKVIANLRLAHSFVDLLVCLSSTN